MDQHNASKIKPMHITSEESVEDMVLYFSTFLCLLLANIISQIKLGDLHEAGILHNLYMRYKNKHIYVSCPYVV